MWVYLEKHRELISNEMFPWTKEEVAVTTVAKNHSWILATAALFYVKKSWLKFICQVFSKPENICNGWNI